MASVAIVVDVRVLGPLEVVDRAGTARDVPGLRPKALLAFLTIAERQASSTDRILDEVWADAPPSSQATTVQMTVSRVRKALGEEHVETTGDGYRLAETVTSDLHRFRQHARRGRQLATLGSNVRAAEAFRHALAEWRGDPLGDLRRLDFAERAAQAIEQERIAVVEDLMDATLASGDHALVLGELSGMTEAFPYRERFWHQLMLALYRSGRQADALATFKRAQDALGESLGIEPSRELRDLEERILLHDPALDRLATPYDDIPIDTDRLEFPAGTVIVEEGEPADTVYWIESGRVEISATDQDGTPQVLAELGPGRYFGELAALLRTNRTATARALVPTTVAVHDAAGFQARLGAEQARPGAGGQINDVHELMASGQNLAAYDTAMSLIEAGADSAELRYLAVLSIARAGATTTARRQHETLGLDSIDPTSVDASLANDLAVLGARLDKDQALATDGEQRAAWAARAAGGYEAAFDESGAHHHAINAATLWLLSGDENRARSLADHVEAGGSDGYWSHASDAEAALILQDLPRATAALERAASAETGSAARASTIKQLRLVADLQGIDRGVLAPLRNQAVVHYCGHLIQAEGSEGRFPASEESHVAESIRRELDALDAGVGFGSLASGADILAAEALLERGAQLNVVLPFPEDHFIDISVAPAGPAWVERFHRCMERATSIEVATSSEYLGDPVLFDFCARIAMGDAIIRAEQLATDAHQIAVWDGTPSGGLAGTAVDVASWKTAGHRTTVIPVTPGAPRGNGSLPDDRRHIRSILFADFAGFSRLTDAQVLRFQADIMSRVGAVLEPYEAEILSGRTWGDGIYLVLDDIASAASCALAMQEAAATLDLEALGLPELRGLRVAAHATPVFDGWDPISGQRLFYGAGVTQAARIEPRTPEGEIYTTRAFATLAVLAGAQSFECQYVGTMPTAKGYGALPLYSLRRRLLAN